MKAALLALYNNPRYAKAVGWAKLIVITGGAQVIIQAIGFISGILVIRLLPTHEYALYTLANTMLGTMTVLADGGIVNGVMAQGGKVWNDIPKLGAVVATGLSLRKMFAVLSFLIVAPILLYLLHLHGASFLLSILIVFSILPAFLTTIYGSLLQIPLKLHQAISSLQKNQLESILIRLVILCISLVAFPWASIALLATGIPQLWTNQRLKKMANTYADLASIQDKKVRKDIIESVKRILPDAVYYCLSGQLTIWLISLVGKTTSIAQIGALTRLNALLTVLSIGFSTLIIPRFARLPQFKNLATYFINAHLILALICLGVISLCWSFSCELLILLGDNYRGLDTELVLCITGGCLNLFIGITFGLYTSRGFAIRPSLLIPLNIVANIVGIIFIDYSTLSGILIFNLFVNGIQLFIHFTYGFLKVSSLKVLVIN